MAPPPVTIGVAFVAGLVSFLSPCIIPLLPVYLAYLAGTTVEEAVVPGGQAQRSLIISGALFVVGLSTTFVWMGALAGWLGQTLVAFAPVVRVVGGLILAAFGLQLLGLWRFPAGLSAGLPRVGGPWRGFLMGAGLAAGWSPCLGPIIGSILVYAAVGGGTLAGAILLAAYSLGLSLPFFLSLVFAPRLLVPLRRVAPYARVVRAMGGVVLLVAGVLVLTGQLSRLMLRLPGSF
ncbi:MAG: cytochrome c biogenesis protein CcdA [Bacillota bacterium]